jgi:RNA polymerase sigma-70 factor (ECF subfamily)
LIQEHRGESVDQSFSDQLVALLPRLRRFALGLTGSREQGDDLVQSACECALARSDQFEPGSRLDSWMYRIVQTVWIDQLRKRRNGEIGLDPADLAEFPGGNGATEAEDRMYLAEVRRAIARLADDHREVLLLICVEGVAYKQAAEILDLPIGTVMSRLSRAHLALGRELEKDGRLRAAVVSPNVVRIKR